MCPDAAQKKKKKTFLNMRENTEKSLRSKFYRNSLLLFFQCTACTEEMYVKLHF